MTRNESISTDLSPEQIQSKLTGPPLPPRIELGLKSTLESPRPAAVLVPLVRENGGWSVLLTARTDLVEDHKGQVSFPGGAGEPGDANPDATALREAGEEIGLPAGSAHILGHLAEYQTISNYLITPVVATVDWPLDLRLESREVRRAFTVPLDFLAQAGNHVERMTTIRGQDVRLVYFEAWQGEVLWGISARIMLDLLIKLGLAA